MSDLDVYLATEGRVLKAETESIRFQRNAFVEALTPSGETKGEYIGEFEFWSEASESYVKVPWTTIKEIMKAITARAMRNIDAGRSEG